VIGELEIKEVGVETDGVEVEIKEALETKDPAADQDTGGAEVKNAEVTAEILTDIAIVTPEPRAGTVVAVGPGRMSIDMKTRIPMPPLQIGQKVVVGAGRGEKVLLEGQLAQEGNLYLFRADELLGYCEMEE